MALASVSWPALCAIALGLGARHALDADHVSVIDGIARRNLHARQARAGLGGLLFSFGHSLVVMTVATLAVTLAARWAVPRWLGAAGAVVSLSVLAGFALVNIRAAWATPHDAAVAPVALRSRLLGRRGGDHPLLIVALGGLFAISFDTVSVAAGLGVAAARFGGAGAALWVAACFAVGMMAVGGASGAWIATLLRATGAAGRSGLRLMTGGVGAINLLVAMLVLAGLLMPAAAFAIEASGATLGIAIIAACAALFAGARRADADGARHGGGATVSALPTPAR